MYLPKRLFIINRIHRCENFVSYEAFLFQKVYFHNYMHFSIILLVNEKP
jgi:hypothetical protein